MSYIVYKHTDPTGKVYVGITKQRPQKRFDYGRGYKHNARFREAIRRYSWAGLRHEIIASGLTQEEAEAKEAELIAKFNSTNPRHGYNVKTGGIRGTGLTPEGRKRLAERTRGDKNPTKVYGHPMQGKHHREESRLKMSAAAKARKGRVCSNETRAKLQAAQIKCAVMNLDTGETFEGIHAAGRAYGLEPSKICAVCKGKRKSTGGYRWAYKGQAAAIETLRLGIVKEDKA